MFYGAISALLKQPLQLCMQTIKQTTTTGSGFALPLEGHTKPVTRQSITLLVHPACASKSNLQSCVFVVVRTYCPLVRVRAREREIKKGKSVCLSR